VAAWFVLIFRAGCPENSFAKIAVPRYLHLDILPDRINHPVFFVRNAADPVEFQKTARQVLFPLVEPRKII
jgi:hypothetical protein